MVAKRDRKAYQADYYRRNKKALNAKRTAVRREKRGEANGAIPKAAAKLTGAAAAKAIADWSAKKLVVPTPPRQGHPFRLADWQVSFLKDAFKPGVKEAALSIARRNGKSFLIAVVLLAHLCGPMRRPNWRAAVVSLTGKLATELREAVRQIAEASGLADQIEVRTSPVPGYILGQEGTRVDILAADKSSGHAIGIDLGVCDETGLLENGQLYNSLLSATGGRDGRVFSISIRGDSEIFERIRERKDSPAVHWAEYCGEADVDLQDDAALEAAIEAANPGIADGIKSLVHVRTLAERAKVHPTSQDAMDFRAQELNAPGASVRETLVSLAEWEAVLVDELPERTGLCYLGIDLGGSVSMGAVVAYWPECGRLECWCAFPALPSLQARGRADGVGKRYEAMHRRGELKTFGRTTLSVPSFLEFVDGELGDSAIRRAGADRYRSAELQEAMHKARLSWRMDWRGTGAHKFAHGSHDVRAAQRAIMDKRIRTNDLLTLRSAIRESEIRRDGAGNPALEKSRQRGRIDALQAMVIACGLAEADRRAWDAPETRKLFYPLT